MKQESKTPPPPIITDLPVQSLQDSRSRIRPVALKLDSTTSIKKTSTAKTPVAKNFSHTSSVESNIIRLSRGVNEGLSQLVRQIPANAHVLVGFGDLSKNASNDLFLLKKKLLGGTSGPLYMKEEIFNEHFQDFLTEFQSRFVDVKHQELEKVKKVLKDTQEKLSKLQKKAAEEAKEYQAKGELTKQNKLMTGKLKSLQETKTTLEKDLRKQFERFKERESEFNHQIEFLKTQLKSSHTKQFTKLNRDNKKLVEDNAELKQKNEALAWQLQAERTKMQNLMLEIESTRNLLFKEVEELQKSKKVLELKLAEMEQQQDQFMPSQKQTHSASPRLISPIASQSQLGGSYPALTMYQETMNAISEKVEKVIDMSTNKIVKLLIEDDNLSLDPEDLKKLEKHYAGLGREKLLEMVDKVAKKAIPKKPRNEPTPKEFVIEEEEDEYTRADNRQASTPELQALREKLLLLKVKHDIQSRVQKQQEEGDNGSETQKGEGDLLQSGVPFSNLGIYKELESYKQEKMKETQVRQAQMFPYYPYRGGQEGETSKLKEVSLSSEEAGAAGGIQQVVLLSGQNPFKHFKDAWSEEEGGNFDFKLPGEDIMSQGSHTHQFHFEEEEEEGMMEQDSRDNQ